MDTLVALLLVAAACAYLGWRAWRALSGRACGCGARAAKGGCPAASSMARDLAAIARGATER